MHRKKNEVSMYAISLVWAGLRPVVMIAVAIVIVFLMRATATVATFSAETQRIEQLRVDRAQFDRELKYYVGDRGR